MDRIASYRDPAMQAHAVLEPATDIDSVLRRIADNYPPALATVQGYIDVARNAFHLSLISALPRRARICDVGGGLGLFSPGCAALGFDAVLVDDFKDAWHRAVAEGVFDRVHRPLGVEIITRDVISESLTFEPESIDAFTVFDTMEHWHSSPKRLFHKLVAALKPGGLFIIGGPNCVNLRKRITVPFGLGKWSQMQDWYEAERFRSHVREPDVADLRYIATDLGLENVRVIGRNWTGYRSRYRVARMITPIVDRALRLRPSLCSDIYMLGRKIGSTTSIAAVMQTRSRKVATLPPNCTLGQPQRGAVEAP
jgi:SAM-dependent methyltransferase